MKQEKTTIMTQCCRMMSCLLVIVFLGISVGQLFHSHKSGIKTEQSADEDASYLTEKCKVCEFYAHKHSKVINLSYPPVLTVPIPEPVTYTSHYFIGNYKFTLQGFTNKGPPAATC
ncbi:hypothetical protein ABDD95_09185 [Mucilaginibacter sp. PAMB04274]|uniref:hypothetical protein n=1 Tax=Mucilaginibacter sp. PAMB04274 TaxID=3138568 RepID=UPI0031F63C6E